jgi:ribulose-5-phosphate 4-epimerase/fuculose-1-phosphate aldolase
MAVRVTFLPRNADSSVAPADIAACTRWLEAWSFSRETVCWARRMRSSIATSLAAYWSRSFSTLASRSLREPSAIRMRKSRSLSPEFVTREDVLELDLEGDVVSRTAHEPYSERVIHAAVLKVRPDVNAVFHGHPPPILPFTCTGVPIRPIVHLGCMFYEGIPLYDDYDVSAGMLISSKEEGERVARVLGSARALLMRGHGCVVVGASIASLMMASIYLRDNAAVQLQAMALGQPKYLSYEEGRAATRVNERGLALERAWSYWVGRAKKAMPDLK